jgi:glycogen(starch) synthase
MEEADKIVAVSNYTKQMIIEHYGIDPGKIEVVWNGIESNQVEGKRSKVLQEIKDRGCKMVLFVGRITVQKGPDYFLKAAKRVLAYDPNVIFVISGSGDMQNQIIRESAEIGISDKVILLGFLRGEGAKFNL